MAGETSGPGPSEQEIRMVALERKFDELLSFVQLIAKRNTDDENQRKEDDKDTSEAEPEGHSNTNATPPRPPTPPKPEGKDSQLDSKIDSLEEKIRLIQGLNSFGNTDFSSMSWFPNMTVPPKFKAPEFEKYNGRGDPMIHLQMYCRKMAPYADNEPLLIQTFQDTLTGNAAEWYSQLKKISHWKEAGRHLPWLNTDLIPVGERIRRCLERQRKIVDMTALMALAEQAAKKAPTKRKEGDVQMIGRNNGRPRQVLPTFTMQPIQPRPIQAPAPTQVPAPAPAPQMPARPVGNQPNDNRWLRKEPRQFTPLPMPMTELYPILIEKSLISPLLSQGLTTAHQRRDFNPGLRPAISTLEKGKRAQPRVLRGVQEENHQSDGERAGGERRNTIGKEAVNQMTPSDFDWYAEINLDDIVEDEMDLDNLQDEEADWGYFMEDDTDEWRDVDFTEFFQFPCLIVPPGFVTPEFEIFYEDGDPEVHLQKYGEKMALHLENELLMISVFPESLSKQSCRLNTWVLKKDEEPYIIPDPGVGEVIVEIKEESSVLSLPALTEGEEEEEVKPLPPAKDPDNATIAEEGEKPLKAPPPKPREVKIGTRCAAEQKEALIALLREFHEIFAWSYQDMPGLDTDIVVHKIPLKPECKPVKASTATDEARSHFEDQGRGGKAIEGRFPKHSNLFGLGSQYSPGAEEGRKTTNVVFSFMDGFSGYNQIKMAEEDKSKTAFVTHWGTFVYDVMPFGLKNAGATYQRAMVTLFHDMIHHEIEKYQLRLNPNKCAFGVTSGKLLGFIVSGRGIEIDPAKVQAIRSMPAPKTEKEIRSFLGRINYIARFIAQLTATCEPLFKLLRKDDVPSFYTSQSKKHPWAACWDNKTRLGRKEQAIYYLSKKFTEPETRYLLVEKTCCALAWASKKLRQYMLYYTTWLVSRMDPIKYIFEKPALTGKIARWQSNEDNQGRWKLYFDGAANAVGSGIGAVLVSPKGQQTPIAVKLGFDCTNNMTEYEACIVGLQAALEFGAYELEVFGDSLLIVSQTNGEWQARDPKLIPYQRYISRLIPKFKFLYKRTHDATLLRCVDAEEANRLIQEMHAGLMGAHANGPFLARKIMRAGYYWLTMERDCIRHVQTCHKCQMYQNSKNAPPQYLHTMASPWPFSAWGMDVIGAITPKASNGHEFILVAIDYFTKWVEACSFKNVTQVAVTRYASSSRFQHHNSAPYRPKMNGAVEAANKNVKKILSKMTETYKDWHEHLPYALCAYRTSVRTSVGATPYSLVYGMEAVLPVEVEIPSLRILSQTQLEEAEWAQARYEQLNFIDEKRLAALCHGQLYQRRIERAYNKKARPRTFQPGDLVLKKRNMALSDPRGKFAPSYEGPYVVKKAFSGGAIILADMDGEEFRSPINSDSVIKYHV
uniref:Uncharacterized protein n=1 Tax=Fagus sylvatica TaxID=28930 RepID=A0A2N9I0X7_FAGSY